MRHMMKDDPTTTVGSTVNGLARLFSQPRSRLYCILPPHMLESIAQNGTPQQRSRALQTLAIDHTLRALRVAPSSAAPATRRRPGMLMLAEGQKRRTISDARHDQNLPGSVVRAEGAPPTGDPAVDEAFDGLGATYDLFWDAYDRNSIDDEGMPMDATVHFGQDYNNAFWNGERMVFGDGDGELFNRFTISIDVMGHELTHGVTEDEAQLVYFFQPGALNESMSDVFGSLVKQYMLKQRADQADWLIGVGLFTAKVNGVALRSMKAPGTAYDDPVLGKDPQPAHMITLSIPSGTTAAYTLIQASPIMPSTLLPHGWADTLGRRRAVSGTRCCAIRD